MIKTHCYIYSYSVEGLIELFCLCYSRKAQLSLQHYNCNALEWQVLAWVELAFCWRHQFSGPEESIKPKQHATHNMIWSQLDPSCSNILRTLSRIAGVIGSWVRFGWPHCSFFTPRRVNARWGISSMLVSPDTWYVQVTYCWQVRLNCLVLQSLLKHKGCEAHQAPFGCWNRWNSSPCAKF